LKSEALSIQAIVITDKEPGGLHSTRGTD